MSFNRLLCLVFRRFSLYVCVEVLRGSWHSSTSTNSLELNHVQVVEWHEVTITAEDVHVALGVDDADVAVTSGGLSAADETKFVFVARGVGVVPSAELPSLLHLLVVLVERLVGVLDQERVHHRY